MTDAVSGKKAEVARNLAMVSYGLLFASIFFAGVPALIAAVIAYIQRDEAPPDLRSHYDFQIRIFCVAFALCITAAACVLGAVISGVAELLTYNRIEAFIGVEDVHLDLSRISIDGRIIGLTVAALLLVFVNALWLVGAPAVGFVRLASGQRIGHSPAR